jgi:hypothetical protein
VTYCPSFQHRAGQGACIIVLCLLVVIVTADIRVAVAEGVKEGLRAKVESFSISKAPIATTRALLDSAGIIATELAPLPKVPAGFLKGPLPPFDWSGGEDAKSALACDTLKGYLKKAGVIFAAAGFELSDVHTKRQYLSGMVGRYEVKGTTDAIIHPFTVARASAARQARCIIDFKKESNLPYEEIQAQIEAEFLAVSSVSHHDVMAVFTDLNTFGHIVRANGSKLLLWEACDIKQTIFVVSRFLLESCSKESVEDMLHPSVPGAPAEKSKRKETQDRLRALGPSADALIEQLSVFREGSLEDWMSAQSILLGAACGRPESPSFRASREFTPSYYV